MISVKNGVNQEFSYLLPMNSMKCLDIVLISFNPPPQSGNSIPTIYTIFQVGLFSPSEARRVVACAILVKCFSISST